MNVPLDLLERIDNQLRTTDDRLNQLYWAPRNLDPNSLDETVRKLIVCTGVLTSQVGLLAEQLKVQSSGRENKATA